MKKTDEAFLRLSEREVVVAIVLFFSTCFLLFFSGYIWGRYTAIRGAGRDFAQEVRHALHIYGNSETSEVLEDFDAADEQNEADLGGEEKGAELGAGEVQVECAV